MAWIKKRVYEQAPEDIDPELKQIISDVPLVPEKSASQTLSSIGADEGFVPGEMVPSIFTETDQDKSRMGIPDPSAKIGGSMTIQQLNQEVTRTNLDWNSRIQEDTPKRADLFGVSQEEEPLPKPRDESDSRMSFPDLSIQQADPHLFDPALPSATPQAGAPEAGNPLFTLREVMLNTQKQVAQGWDAMVKIFESNLRTITSGMFIAPDEEDLP